MTGPVDLVPLRLVHSDAADMPGERVHELRQAVIAAIERERAAAAITLWFYDKDDDPDPRSVPPDWTINWMAAPDWRRNWVNPNEAAPDCDVATFERPGRSVFVQRADLERLVTEQREAYVIRMHLEWFRWRNLRDGELEQALLRAWGEDALPQSAGAEEVSDVQPEAQQPQQPLQPSETATKIREADPRILALRAAHDSGVRPGKNCPWKEFAANIVKACGHDLAKPPRGFHPRQLGRLLEKIIEERQGQQDI